MSTDQPEIVLPESKKKSSSKPKEKSESKPKARNRSKSTSEEPKRKEPSRSHSSRHRPSSNSAPVEEPVDPEKLAALKRQQDELAAKREALAKEQAEWLVKKEALEKERRDAKDRIAALETNHGQMKKREEGLQSEIAEMKVKTLEREVKLYEEISALKTSLLRYEKNDEEEETAVNWNAPITHDNQSGRELSVRGQWSGASAGGSLNHITWRNNPMILLTVKKNTTVTFSLFQPKSDRQHAMSFYVIRTGSPVGRRLIKKVSEDDIVAEAYFSTLKPSRVTVSHELLASPSPYIVMPACFLPGDESQFVMKFRSTEEVTARLTSPDRDSWFALRGEWRGVSAGGCPNTASFVKNPQYLLKVKKATSLELHLHQWEKDHSKFDAIGLYLIKADNQKRITEYNSKDTVKYLEFRNCHDALMVLPSVAAGSYVVIPCTFAPNQESTFKLSVLYQEEPYPFELTLL